MLVVFIGFLGSIVYLVKDKLSNRDSDLPVYDFTGGQDQDQDQDTSNYPDGDLISFDLDTISTGSSGSSDEHGPGIVESLRIYNKGENWVYWVWNNPSDDDFDFCIVYLDGEWIANTSNNHFNATGLSSYTYYTLTVNTVDEDGNINKQNVSSTARTLPSDGQDIVPPREVRELNATQFGTDWIYWTWINPSDSDFAYSIVYVNDNWMINTTNQYFNFTGAAQNYDYTIRIETVDLSGNINEDAVEHTAQIDGLAPAPVSGLSASDRGADYIQWVWVNPSDSDFKRNLIFLNGVNIANTTNNWYKATGLSQNTQYTINVRPMDERGNIEPIGTTSTTTTCVLRCNEYECWTYC